MSLMNDMNSQKSKTITIGSYQISQDALATIIDKAASSVEGVATRRSKLISSLSHQHKTIKNLRTIIGHDNIALSLAIGIEYGQVIPQVAGQVQREIKSALESMTGLVVKSVDVAVDYVSFRSK